jgi:hypothetical protein
MSRDDIRIGLRAKGCGHAGECAWQVEVVGIENSQDVSGGTGTSLPQRISRSGIWTRLPEREVWRERGKQFGGAIA